MYPKDFRGSIIEKLSSRKGNDNHVQRQRRQCAIGVFHPCPRLVWIPFRIYDGYRGEGIINAVFDGYQPFKGELPSEAAVPWLLLKAVKRLPMASIMPRKGVRCSSAPEIRYMKEWL